MFGRWKIYSENTSSLTAKNFEHNKKLCKRLGSGLLHGQEHEPVCSMRYGKYDMHHCGCEIIAVYNVMQLLHMPQVL